MPDSSIHRHRQVLLAAGLAALALLLRLALDGVLGERGPYLLPALATGIASYRGGFRAGLLCAALSGAGALLLFVPPRQSLAIESSATLVEALQFAAVALGFSALGGRLRQTRARLAAEESKLRESDEFHAAIASLSTDFAYYARLEPDGRLILEAASEGFERVLGWTVEEVNARGGWGVIVHPREHARIAEAIAALPGGETQSGEVVGLARDGREVLLRYSSRPVFRDGRPIGVYGAVKDVTGQRAYEKTIAESEERLRSLIGAASTILWNADASGRFASPQPAWSAYTGFAFEELRDAGWLSAIHAEDRARVGRNWNRAIRDVIPFAATGRLWHAASRTWRRCEMTGAPIFDAEGRVREWVGECRDIEDRHRAAAAMEDLNQQLRIVTDAMSASVARLSRERRFLWVSRHYAEWLGRTPESIVGRHIDELVSQESVAEVEPTIERVLEGETVRFEIEADIRGVGRRWVQATYTPTRDAAGVPDGWVSVVFDIDARKRAEQQLIESDRRKDEFLATLAHELRNPLAPIRNALEILKLDGGDAAARRRAGEILERQVRHMVRLVDDLLDVSRVTRGTLEIRREVLDLREVLSAAIETSRPLIEAGGHELSVALPAETLPVEGDPVRLAQVFSNLLNNAAKFMNPGGRVWVSAARRGNVVAAVVRDAGYGIPVHLRSQVFDMFSQAHRAGGHHEGGLGVGLTLVKRLVQLHGGSVEIEDGEGGGTRFTVRLPAAAADPAAATPAPAPRAPARTRPRGSRRRVLVADDNPDSVASLTLMLELMGHEVRTAADGQEAVEIAAAWEPEVVVLDIGMPRLNGFDAARRIRAMPWAREALIVAVTGWGADEDRRRSKEAGFDHHMVKPASPEVLQTLIAGRDPAARL